jgi:PilZ domain
MKDQGAQDRRGGERFVISYPIRVRWKDPSGAEVVQEGLTDNVGPQGTLVYLPRHLPSVGSKVKLTVTEDPNDEISVTAQVIRLERNASHPQAALQLTDSLRLWKKKVWESARATLAAMEPEPLDDW